MILYYKCGDKFGSKVDLTLPNSHFGVTSFALMRSGTHLQMAYKTVINGTALPQKNKEELLCPFMNPLKTQTTKS